MKKILLTIFVILAAQTLWAQSSRQQKFKVDVEPVFGVETVYRSYPESHTATQMNYGMRVTLGVPLLSLEAEYLQSKDTKDRDTAPERIEFKEEKMKLGLRSQYNISSHLTATIRAGAQVRKREREESNGGVITTLKEPDKTSPYAGAQIGFRMGANLSLHLGSTVVFNDLKDFSKNDIQNTISFRVGI